MDVEPAEHSIRRQVSAVDQHDEAELAEFGYKQELRRDWGLMHNFGISFSIIVSLRMPSFDANREERLFD
jgi:hypothetical protein